MNTAALSPLRFLAALIIIFFHNRLGSDFLKTVPKFLLAGPQMVTFFYVLSGFVLVLAYYGKHEFCPKEFFVKRAARILPVYLIALSLSVAIKIFEGNLNPVALVLNILLLQSWIPSYPLAINGPAWFLSGLMFFYVSFPFVLSYLRNSRPNPKQVFVTCLLFWFATQAILTLLLNSSFFHGAHSYSHDFIYYFPPVHLCSFFLGVSGAYFLLNVACGDNKLSKANQISLILLLCIIFITFVQYQLSINKILHTNLPYASSFYAPFFLAIIAAISTSENIITYALSKKLFIFLGNISFSIYIIQNPVLYIAYRIKPIHMNYDIFLLIYISLLLFIGTLILYTVERPANDHVIKRMKKRAGS